MLLGTTCACCRRPGPVLCAACRGRLVPAPALLPPLGLDTCVALLVYEGAGRDLVVAIKYRNRRAALALVGAALAERVADTIGAWAGEASGRAACGGAGSTTPGWPDQPTDGGPDRPATEPVGGAAVAAAGPARCSSPIDVVTWAPTSPARRHARGYDQAQLLARVVARHLGRPCRGLLRRVPGPPQTGRHRDERWHGPAFTVPTLPSALAVARLLVVDDVVTTGATLAAAGAALHRAGAGVVHGAAVGHTPRVGQRAALPPATASPARAAATRDGARRWSR